MSSKSCVSTLRSSLPSTLKSYMSTSNPHSCLSSDHRRWLRCPPQQSDGAWSSAPRLRQCPHVSAQVLLPAASQPREQKGCQAHHVLPWHRQHQERRVPAAPRHGAGTHQDHCAGHASWGGGQLRRRCGQGPRQVALGAEECWLQNHHCVREPVEATDCLDLLGQLGRCCARSFSKPPLWLRLALGQVIP